MITLKEVLLRKMEHPLCKEAPEGSGKGWVEDWDTTADLVVSEITEGPFFNEMVDRMVHSGHFAGILPREKDRRAVFSDLLSVALKGDTE